MTRSTIFDPLSSIYDLRSTIFDLKSMTRTRLLLETLVWHWRTNLAVLLGVAVGAALLSGALIVGDSVRGSLRDMTLKRLGSID
ncbi:MAG: hypothetical protein L0Y39_09710, partial [Methylococcaceae bacterium]|nr:hypothetical protein [Methylococcaceae bacterium]